MLMDDGVSVVLGVCEISRSFHISGSFGKKGLGPCSEKTSLPLGLRKEVSKLTSTGSGVGKDCREGEGARTDESYSEIDGMVGALVCDGT